MAGPPTEPPPEWETPRWQNESPPPPARLWQEEPPAPQQPQWPDEPAWQPEEPRWPEQQPYEQEQEQGYGQQEPAYPDQAYPDQAYQQPYAPDQPRYPEEPPAEPAFPEPRFGGPPYGGSPYAGSPYAEQQPPWMGSGQGQYDQQYEQNQYEQQYDQSQYEPGWQQQEPPPRMGPAPASGAPKNRKKLIIIVAAVAALGLAGGGAYVLMDKGSGSSGSETPHSSAWLDDVKPAASAKTVGGAAGDKNFPLSFDVPAGWNSAPPGAAAGDYKPVATVKAAQGATLTVVHAPDGAPEDAVRKYATASSAGGAVSGLITRQMDAAGAHGGEGQWQVSGQRHRAIAVSHNGAVYLVVLVTADASYRTDLPAYLLARNSLTFS